MTINITCTTDGTYFETAASISADLTELECSLLPCMSDSDIYDFIRARACADDSYVIPDYALSEHALEQEDSTS